MKKMFFAAMMVAMATVSFAQDISKEIKGQPFEAAMAKVDGAQVSAEMKAKAYNQVIENEYAAASKAFDAAVLGQQVDGMPMYNCIAAALKCDEFDQQPNDKGKVAPKFFKKNNERLGSMRIQLVTVGQKFLNTDNATALKYLSLYCDASKSNLFGAQAAKETNTIAQVSRIVGFIHFQQKDYKKALESAKVAMADESVKEDAEPIYVASMEKLMENKQDTLNFINALKELNAQKYFAYMASLYNRIGEKELAEKLVDEEIANNPGNKMAWATKGENAMNNRDWDTAIENFKKTVEIDPTFVQVWFNLGVCSSSKGFDMNEKFSDKQGRIKAEDAEKVKAALNDAKTYYEKVRELDPNHETIPNWPMQLRMIYNALGDTEKANEISKMLGDM